MLQLEWEWKGLCRRNRHGSFATQSDRKRHVEVIVTDLEGSGFSQFVRQKGSAARFGEKHILRLVKTWHRRGLSTRTIDNRLATCRTLLDWQGRAGVLKPDNEFYRGEAPPRVRTEARRTPADDATMRERILALENQYARASLLLQLEFGIRREEALKVQPRRSTGDVLVLHGSACKGGRPRSLLADTEGKRDAIRLAKEVAGKGSLIPPRLSYAGWRDRGYRDACRAVGLEGTREDPIGTHVLRHERARQDYEQRSGMASPLDGGPYRAEMTRDEKARDRAARDEVADQMGHGRRAIAAAYVGGTKDQNEEETGE